MSKVAVASKAPAPTATDKQQLLEMEQRMVRELKAQNYHEAKEAADAVLKQAPGNKRVQEFSRLLHELIAGREEESSSSSESDTEEEGDVAGNNDQARDGEQAASSGESSSSDSSEDSSSDEEEEEEGQASSSEAAADAAATQLSGLALDTSNLRMNHASRAELRKSLGAGIKALKEKQHMEELIANDPLLG